MLFYIGLELCLYTQQMATTGGVSEQGSVKKCGPKKKGKEGAGGN
jgi:hypothetical protein